MADKSEVPTKITVEPFKFGGVKYYHEAFVSVLKKQLATAQADAARLRVFLKRVEWNWMHIDGRYGCMCCGNGERQGHAPGCELNRMVKEGE